MIELVITDGAGTLFDPGSVVPAYAFQSAFRAHGIDVSLETIMKYMGRNKLEHTSLVLQDVNSSIDPQVIYETFKEELYPSAHKTEEIPGVKEAAYRLKDAGIPLVMTTGYDRKMVDETTKKLPWLDELLLSSVTSSDVMRGRPAPDMIYKAMKFVDHAVKVGDTEVDIEAADNAGIPGILVTSGSIKEAVTGTHLVLPSLARVINYVIDGTLESRLEPFVTR